MKLFWAPFYPDRLEVGFFIEMGGLEIDDVLDPSNATNGQVASSNFDVRGRVTSSGALFLERVGLLPHMDIPRIKDKSKFDLLAKVLVCLQVSWMVVQCVAREFTGLPLSLLELNTVMHVMCALLTYGMWFKKPQDVGFPTTITPAEATKNLTCDQIKELEDCIEPLEDKSKSLQLNSSTKSDIAEVSIFIGAILGLIASGAYGGVHLSVWHGHFPTRVERGLWRISGCIIVGMPVFVVLFLLLLQIVRGAAGLGTWKATVENGWTYTTMDELEAQSRGAQVTLNPKTSWNPYHHHVPFMKDLKKREKWVMLIIYIVVVALQTVAIIIYFSARAYVVVEAFLSLRSVPKGVYDKVWWVELIPHF